MAVGGNPNNHNNNHKGSSSTSSSQFQKSSFRKSRWDNNHDNFQSDHKPNSSSKDSKPSYPKKDESTTATKLSSSSKPQPDQAYTPSGGSGMFNGGGGSPFTDPVNFGPPPPPPSYGFHMLERRTIVMADGNVRTYLALPPDYQDLPGGRHMDERGIILSDQGDYWNSVGLDGRGSLLPPEGGSLKRKYGDGDERDPRDLRDPRDEFSRQRQQLLQYGNPNGFPLGHADRGGGDYLAGTSSPFGRDPMLSARGMDDHRSQKHLRVGGDYGSSHSRHVGHGNDSNSKFSDVDTHALKKSFLHYVQLLNENPAQRKEFLEDGKHGRLKCLACGSLLLKDYGTLIKALALSWILAKEKQIRGKTLNMLLFLHALGGKNRASKEFSDVHGLIMHTYNSVDLRVDHLGLHKALCVSMGWNYAKAPENSKSYQSLSADEAAARRDDLIMWPPLVIIHNTNSGRGKDGHVEGMGNKTMDNKLRDLGFIGGKAKSLFGKDGHLGITLVKFGADQPALKEAMRLAEYFEKDNHGRGGWARAQSLQPGRNDENNPNLVRVDPKTGEKTRILFGYLGTASDLDKVDYDTRKKTVIESRRECRL
ncbi:hypothetical protein C5167_043435 [Papaver somniferum]|uniref:XS domain-containing protein n=1 Tax=Papaver somniferum TaxID=3469 RepID=A0A4Y7L9K1_PAPSO|nr:hypothetical protein C5167_043435 [Papaver somniferum]